MKFIGALGFASARENKPAVDVAEGGKGCCGYTFVRTVVAGRRGGTYACAWIGRFADAVATGGVAGKIGKLGYKVVACKRRETKCW